MRIAKGIIGWLCIFSLVTAVLYGCWLCIWITRFYAGGGASYYYHRNMEDRPLETLVSQLPAGGLNRSDSELLRRFAVEGPLRIIRSDWWAVVQQNYPERQEPTTLPAAAAAVTDARGNVVAAYPDRLIGVLPRLRETQKDAWLSNFYKTALQDNSHLDPPEMRPILDRRGRQIGTIAVSWKYYERFSVVPASARLPMDIRPWTLVITIPWALLACALLLPVWVGMDAAWRGMRPFAWGILALLTGLIGLIAYLIARVPAPQACPNCEKQILAKYVRCPTCGISLPTKCPACGARLKPGWQYCPKCAGVPPELAEPAQAQTAASTTPARAGIRMAVSDAESGGPIPAAQVSVKGPSRVEGLTNPQGVFEARKLRSGRYTITAAKYSHKAAEAELDLGEEGCEIVELKLTAMPASIVGRVVERISQKPVEGAHVYLDSSRVDRSTKTDGSGGFVLADVPPGPYTIRAEAEEFDAQTKLVEAAPGRQTVVDLALERASNAEGENAHDSQ